MLGAVFIFSSKCSLSKFVLGHLSFQSFANNMLAVVLTLY